VPVRGVQQRDLAAAAGGVPDQQQQVAGVVGVQALQLARRHAGVEDTGVAAPAGRAERDGDGLAAGAARVGGQVGDQPVPVRGGRMIARSVEPRSG
jgi:hypothetical protein